MPVCTWCGIESKSDLVCDWCKRPLALRAQRKSDGGRSAVDLLRDGEDGASAFTPKVLAIAGVVGLVVILIIVWAMGSRQGSSAAAADNTPSAASQDFVAQRDSAFGPRSASAPAPASARSVFLPQAVPSQNQDFTGKSVVDTGASSPTAHFQKVVAENLSRVTVDDGRETGGAGPSVRLTGGLIRSAGGKYGVSIGHVTITNTTENNVVEYRLEAVINGRSYTLQPFEGSPNKPRAMKSSTIEAGERISLPVIVKSFNGGKKNNVVPARIMLNAWLDAGSSVVRDELLTP